MKENGNIKVYSLDDDIHENRFFKIERMEDHYVETAGITNTPHRHDFYLILWLICGKGTHNIDFNTYELAENQIYFLTPGQIHQLDAIEKPLGWAIYFSPDFLIHNNIPASFIDNIRLFRPYHQSPPLSIDDSVAAKLKTLTSQMKDFANDHGPFNQEGLGALLKLFLIHCNNACDMPMSLESKSSCILIDFRKEVEAHFKQTHKVNEYANWLHITPKYLNEVIKDSLGYTAKEYILDRIMMEAKRMLLHSQMSVKQIAIELGFKEPLHFNAFFKKSTNISPGAFRNEFKPLR